MSDNVTYSDSSKLDLGAEMTNWGMLKKDMLVRIIYNDLCLKRGCQYHSASTDSSRKAL